MTRPAQPRNMTHLISHDRQGETSKKIISIQGATVKIFFGIKMAAASSYNCGLSEEGEDLFWIFVTARVSRCPVHSDAFIMAKGRFAAGVGACNTCNEGGPKNYDVSFIIASSSALRRGKYSS